MFVDEIVRSPSGKADYRWARQVAAGRPDERSTGRRCYGRDMRREASFIVAGAVLAACSDDSHRRRHDVPSDQPPQVATFQVADEQFKIELITPELVGHAQQLLDGEDVAKIPLGKIVPDDPSVNAPWSWHIDPTTLEFADVTIAECDGLPSAVEDGSLTSDSYCPWQAEVVAVEPP